MGERIGTLDIPLFVTLCAAPACYSCVLCLLLNVVPPSHSVVCSLLPHFSGVLDSMASAQQSVQTHKLQPEFALIAETLSKASKLAQKSNKKGQTRDATGRTAQARRFVPSSIRCGHARPRDLCTQLDGRPGR